MNNAAKSLDILVTWTSYIIILNYNYQNYNKVFLNPDIRKFLDTLAKLFFPCIELHVIARAFPLMTQVHLMTNIILSFLVLNEVTKNDIFVSICLYY